MDEQGFAWLPEDDYQPREKWMYSTGADVLGVLIARAYGPPFETFLRQRIFEPLGMTDTGFAVPAAQLGRLPLATGPARPAPLRRQSPP